MSDLKLVAGVGGFYDIDFDGTDLVFTDALENGVLISVETIARAKPDDDLPQNNEIRRGNWRDQYLEIPMGSRLWILSRSKMEPSILSRINQLFFECLEWMELDGVATRVLVTSEIYNDEIIFINARIQRPKNIEVDFPFYYNWEAQRLTRNLEAA